MALLQAADIPFESAACRPWRQQLRSAGDPLFAPDDPAPLPAARVAPRDGTAVWLFADSPRHWPLGAIPAQRSAALAFVIGPFGATQTRLPASDSAVQKLQVDGSCTVTRSSVAAQVTIEIGDTAGYRMIDQLRQSTADARALAARQIGQQIFQDFRMRSAALIDIEPAGTPLRIELELEHTGPQATDQDRWLLSLPLPMAQLRRAFGDRDDRRQPFRLEQDIDFRARIRLHPGDGRVMVDLPPPSLRSFGPLDYQLTFTRDGEAVVIERRLRLRPGTIPVATYPDWIRLLAELDRAEQQKLVLDQR